FVDLQARLAVPGRSGEVQLDSTEGVDDPGEPAEVDFEVVVDADPGLPADRLHQQVGPAERVGGVDLVDSVAGDLHPEVARDREQLHFVRNDLHQHDHVGAGPGEVAELAFEVVGKVLPAVGA